MNPAAIVIGILVFIGLAAVTPGSGYRIKVAIGALAVLAALAVIAFDYYSLGALLV